MVVVVVVMVVVMVGVGWGLWGSWWSRGTCMGSFVWHTCVSLTVTARLMLPRAAVEHHSGYVWEVMLRLCCGYVTAAASARRA